MLLRFGASNFRSVKAPQELSLTVSSLKDVEAGLLHSDVADSRRVLPAAVIYGANASGKSNVIEAFHFMLRAVLLSHRQGTPGGPIPRTTFKLDPTCIAAPSTFDVDFIEQGVRYNYGFEATDTAFNCEWLYAFPAGRPQLLFRRDQEKYKFGRQLRGQNKVISELTRPNSLFFSAALQNDHEQLSKIGSFFEDSTVFRELSIGPQFLADFPAEERVLSFLKVLDASIVDQRHRKIDIPALQGQMLQDIQDLIKTKYAKDFPTAQITDSETVLELGHRNVDGETIYFDVKNESAGTRRLLVLLLSAFGALDKGSLLIVDELDASLHTQAAEALLSLFLSTKLNTKGAQLIATTHDTNLLRSPLLRRDQIWFTEKDSEGATHLYPLSDFRTRQDDNLEKGYLQGRYGAIPFVGSLDDVL